MDKQQQNYQQKTKPKVNFSYGANSSPTQQVPIPKVAYQTDLAEPVQQIEQVQSYGYGGGLGGYGGYGGYGMNQYGGAGGCIPPPPYETKANITLLNDQKEDKEKKVVAVIVSFINGCSYDQLFTSVEQKSQEGTRVLVYSCTSPFVATMLKGFKAPETIENELLKDLVKHVQGLDPDCVVFNWECSSNYNDKTFTEGKAQLFEFLKLVIDRGHMAMFSDFSLKALINEWSVQHLGPNPFIQTGETSNAIELYFKGEDLADCPSAQLQTVGEMAEGGKVHVEVMGGTIVYTVKDKKPATDLYELKILTVAANEEPIDHQYPCQVGEKKGNAGHVLLTYKSGGHLLTSMGHWVELMRVDTSEKKLFEMAERQYGAGVATQMRQAYCAMDVQSQQAYISREAVNMVQNQAPCSNMSMKVYPGKKG